MKIQAFILLLITILVSCEKPAPVSRKESATTTEPTLAAAQLSLAKSHLAEDRPEMALPYLEASLSNHPLPKVRELFDTTLASTRFSVPVLRLDHPEPVLEIAASDGNVHVALGGPFPTVLRWDLTDTPDVAAVLFPTDAKTISHLVTSGNYLLVQRDSTNLLCHSDTLRPIASIGPVPPGLDPYSVQRFSGNSLLLAHPIASENQTLIWHIRDSATGEILRSETFDLYPKPISATFEDTELRIGLEDGTAISVPLQGEVSKTKSNFRARVVHPPVPFTVSENAVTRHLTFSPDLPPPPNLLPALTGFRLDPVTQSLEEIPTADRLRILSGLIPGIPPTLRIVSARDAVETRLAAAFPEKFPALSLPARTHAEIVRSSFASGHRSAILATISALPPYGLPTATALLLAHQSGDPELLAAVLDRAANVPPALKSIHAPGTEIPDITTLRTTQDWLGYEAPDFTPLFRDVRTEKSATLSELNLSESPTEEEIQNLFTRLLAPETLRQLGPLAISNAATSAARTLSHSQMNATSALKFAAIAERMGAHPAEVLRIRATAFTSLADFTSAHRSWLDLITNQPEASHVSNDYAEAAYTAFENADPRQAIEILETGIFRFPRDTRFAIRAGWIALLTHHPEHAAKYLAHATNLGLPADEIENTTALLAIAHSQLGDPETADSYLAQLRAIDEAWSDPESLEKLPWPDSFKQALRSLTSDQEQTPPAQSPENDPKDTALPSGEFPIEEPPLPSR